MKKRIQGDPEAARPGTMLGGYRVEEVIGAGGMGVVYRAVQVSLDREVALKVLNEQLASDPSARQRFIQEGILAARVVHPNVVRVLDVAEHEGHLLLAYELVAGGTLRQRLDREGRLPAAEAIEICATCADVLTLLHGQGILHRDLKPANIFLSPGRGPLVGDLGIAKDLGGGQMVTQAGLLLGTPAYMAPELVNGSPASASSDLYALGVVFFECLTGSPPFEGPEPLQTLRRHLSEPAPDPASTRPELPPAYTELTRRALAKDPAGRFPDAGALASALRQLPPPGPARSGVRTAAPARTVELRMGRRPSRMGASATLRLEEPTAIPQPRPGRRTWLLFGAALVLLACGILLRPEGRDESPVAGAGPGRPSVTTATAAVAPLAAPREFPTTRPAEPSSQEAPFWLAVPSRVGDRTNWPGLDAACRQIRADAAALVDLNRQLRRHAAEQTAGKILEATRQAHAPQIDAAGEALKAMAPLVATGRPGAARRTGELLASLFLVTEECRKSFLITLGAWVGSGSEADLMMEGMRVPPFIDRLARSIGASARTLASKLPHPLLESGDPALKGGLTCLRAMGLLDSDGVARRKEQQETFNAARGCLEKMLRPPRPPRPDSLVARALLKAIWTTEQPQEALKVTLATLAHAKSPPGPGPVDPWEELLVLDLIQEAHRLAEPYLCGAASREEAAARRLDDLVDARDRLLERWPYDARRVPPARGPASVVEAASLHLDMQFALVELLATTRELARRRRVPLRQEPRGRQAVPSAAPATTSAP